MNLNDTFDTNQIVISSIDKFLLNLVRSNISHQMCFIIFLKYAYPKFKIRIIHNPKLSYFPILLFTP